MPPIPIRIGAAVIDSINPCAFGVLIFLLSYLIKTKKKKGKLLTHGLTYILAVFLTYLFAGILLLPVIGSLGSTSVLFYAVVGILTICFGLLELKDVFWYGKGPSLSLLPGASQRIKLYAKHITGSLWSSFMLGMFVAIVELPCTGAVYLAILSLFALHGVQAASAFWLVIYNIIFVLPLIVILFGFYFGIKADAIENWRKHNRKGMRLLIGLLLIALGGWMLSTALL
jgi:cytochrome c biogenesis protein CcdA